MCTYSFNCTDMYTHVVYVYTCVYTAYMCQHMCALKYVYTYVYTDMYTYTFDLYLVRAVAS